MPDFSESESAFLCFSALVNIMYSGFGLLVKSHITQLFSTKSCFTKMFSLLIPLIVLYFRTD